MDLNSSFRSAQSKFYKWTTDWALMGENPESNITPDLLDLITIFQILGFTVCHADAHDPHDVSKLSCGEKGLKISVSCGHSGVRFVLEGINKCSCSEKMVDSIRQLMLLEDQTQKSESFSNISLLNVPAGEKQVIQTVLTHLVEMMHAAAKDNDQNENILKTEIKNTAAENLNTTENMYTANVPIIKQEQEDFPKVVMSPGRHRSLDTLTGKSIADDLPEPGNLKREDEGEKNTVTHSSPNLTLPLKPSNISSPVANVAVLKQGYSKLLSVQEMVKDVIEILEKAQEIPKFSFDVSHIKASTESLCVKKSTRTNSSSDPDLIVKRNVKLLCRPSIRSASSSSVKSTVATSSGSLTKPRKSSDNISPNFKVKPSLLSSATKSQKFAHVKSTIPKGSTSKKL